MCCVPPCRSVLRHGGDSPALPQAARAVGRRGAGGGQAGAAAGGAGAAGGTSAGAPRARRGHGLHTRSLFLAPFFPIDRHC